MTNRLGNVVVSLNTFSSAFNQRKGIDLEKSGSNFKLRYIEIIVVKEITHFNRIYITNWIYFNLMTRESWTLNAERKISRPLCYNEFETLKTKHKLQSFHSKRTFLLCRVLKMFAKLTKLSPWFEAKYLFTATSSVK